MDEKRFKEIKYSYSNSIDLALSNNETLPEYEIEVADLNFLIKTIEDQQKEIKTFEFAFKGADKICNDYAIKKHQLEKELDEYRAAAALNSSGVNLYEENQHLKQVIEYTKSLLVELKKETEFAHIQTMIGYIEKLEKVAKK